MYTKFSQVHCAFSLLFFFSIVLQKWIYSCFSKLVQNKVFWKKIFKSYPHQLKTHWGFCTDGAQFLPLPFPPCKRAFSSSLHMTSWANMPAQLQASSAPKASTSSCTWLRFPKFTWPHHTDNLKTFSQTFDGAFWGRHLYVPDAEGSTLYRPHEEKKTLIIQVKARVQGSVWNVKTDSF